MLRHTKAKVIGLVLVGVVALGGAVYAATALAPGGASAAPAPAQAAQTVTDSQLRSSILDMLKDRMGLTGPDAAQFADQMIARMQGANPGFDLQTMVNSCTRYKGWGMMHGNDPANGAPTPGTGSPDPSSATPSSPGPQNGGWGMMNGPGKGSVNGGRGMMGTYGGGMMGTSTLK
jgi:hypothetical protein